MAAPGSLTLYDGVGSVVKAVPPAKVADGRKIKPFWEQEGESP
jgi:hypothetical protein